MFMKKLSLGCAIAATATFAAVSAQADTVSLAHFVPPQHIVTASVVEPLVNGAAADTDGALTIEVFPAGELGAGPGEQYVRALQGIADIVWGVTGYTSSQFEKTMIIELPGVFQGRDGSSAIYAALDDHLLDEFPGTKPLAVWTAEPNIIIMRDKEVRTPEDLKGMRIRVSGSIPARVIEALGATPVQMSASEGYNALQNGLVDGTITGASAVRDFRYNEVANHFTLGAALGHVSFYLTMSQAAYDKLPDAEKAAIDANAGLALAQSGEAGWNAHADGMIEMLRADAEKTVIDLTADEIAAFNDITLAVRDAVVAELDEKGLDASATLDAMMGAAK